MQRSLAVQCFSDGVFLTGIGGAFGAEVVAQVEHACGYQGVRTGYTFTFVKNAKDAFAVDIHGLDRGGHCDHILLRACASVSWGT